MQIKQNLLPPLIEVLSVIMINAQDEPIHVKINRKAV